MATRYDFGDIRVDRIVEMEIPIRPAKVFLPDLTDEQLDLNRHWLRSSGALDERDWLVLCFQSYVVRSPRHTILVDTCVGNDRQGRNHPRFNGRTDGTYMRALAAAVVKPATGEVYTASAGGGAYLGRSRLQVATGKQLSLALVGTGFSYDSRRRGLQAEAVSMLIPRVRDIRRIGAASLDLCNVAAGRLDAYYEKGLKPWDHAGGALVAAEAGAKVAGLHGAAASRTLTIAAEPGLFAQLEPVLDELGVVDR